MTYEHVAMIPFLLDASHLSPQEAAERDANPALWAAQRYGQPEHIFQAAAKRHGDEKLKRAVSRPLVNYATSDAPSRPITPRLAPQTGVPGRQEGLQGFQSQQSSLDRSSIVISSAPPDPASSSAASPPKSYFSTVLLPPASSIEIDSRLTPCVKRNTSSKETRSSGQAAALDGSGSSQNEKLHA